MSEFDSRLPETYLAGLPQALRGVDFPADRDDIVEMMSLNGALPVLVDRIKDLPEGDYDSPEALRAAIDAP